MRCHEILNIKENASPYDIEQAYSSKKGSLDSQKDVLGLVPYNLKVQEIEAAKEECLHWSGQDSLSRIRQRITETGQHNSNDVRLNEFCCGPCTFTDICCGACVDSMGCDCLCPEVEVSCCHTVCGNQAVPIIADIAILGYWAWSLYSKWKEKQEAEAREYRIRQAEKATLENVQLEDQLTRCRSEQRSIQEKLRDEEKLNNRVVAHIALFTAIGTANLQPIYDNQQRRVQGKRDELERAKKRERELQDKIKKVIGYVQQNQKSVFGYTVFSYVLMGRASSVGLFQRPSKDDEEMVHEVLDSMGIGHLADVPITEISGGERQQAAIARAIVQKPQAVFFDEPTAHLDYGNQVNTLKLIASLRDKGFAVVMTTHNPDHCMMLGGNVAILDRQGFLETGSVEEILTEERLKRVYNTELRLSYVDAVHRVACIPYGLHQSHS